MNVRVFYPADLERITDIHGKFYGGEFPLDDFMSRSMFKFVVLDDSDKIITAASVRTIPEIIAITDKDISVKSRRSALLETLQCAAFLCAREGHNQLHAFVQDEVWIKHLKTYGFKDCKGKAVYINVGA